MTDNNDKPESNIVPGNENIPEKRDTTQEDAESKARHEALFSDLDEEETPEEIKAQRDVMWKKVIDMDSRLGVYQQDKLTLTAKLNEQNAEAALALAKIRDLAEAEKASALEAFVKEVVPVAEGLVQSLGAISKEQREADPKFDKLTQGVEKTLSQFMAAFNKSGGKTSAPKDTAAEVEPETVAETTPKASTLKERVIRETETPEEIRAERDYLLQQMAEMANKMSKAQQDSLSLTRQLAARKTEAGQALLRLQNQLHEQKAFALEKFVKEILPVVDNLERGLTAIPKAQRAADAKFESLAQDVGKTLGRLTAVFNKFGIRAIDPTGEAFDPEKHEAVGTADSADVESETVVSVAQKGYELNDRVIRPAKVVVKP